MNTPSAMALPPAGNCRAVGAGSDRRAWHGGRGFLSQSEHASGWFGRRYGRQVLQEHGWPEERILAVLHCIRAHRYRDDSEQPQTLEAKVLFDADKLDAIGAVGVARAIAYAAQVGEPAYAKPSSLFIRTGEREPGEGHSAYHEYVFKLKHLSGRLYTTAARQIAVERHQYMENFFTRMADEWES